MSNGETVTIYKASSDSNPGSYYEVRFHEDGTARCECPSSVFKTGGECKHTRRLRSQGLGFRGPQPTVAVYQLTYGDATVVVTDDHVVEGVDTALNNLRPSDELAVKRLV